LQTVGSSLDGLLILASAMAKWITVFLICGVGSLSFSEAGYGQVRGPSTAPDTSAIAYVNGVKISRWDYHHEIDGGVLQLQLQNKDREPTEDELGIVRQEAWDHLLTRTLIRANAEKLGIVVTDEQVLNQLLESPPKAIRMQFTDSLGKFHNKEYRSAIKDPRNDSMLRHALIPPLREQTIFEEWQRKMISTMMIPDSELWARFYNEHAKAEIQLLTIATTDSLAPYIERVTLSEISNYYESHKNLFAHPEERKTEFVIFPNEISKLDSFEFARRINTIAAKVGTSASSWQRAAAALTAQDASSRRIDEHVLLPQELPDTLSAEQIVALKPGNVLTTFTPFGARVTRITSVAKSKGLTFHTRHILVSFGYPENRDSARLVALSIYKRLHNGEDFATLARDLSADPGSAGKGGDLGWVTKGVFVKEFEDVALKAKLHSVQPPFASAFGYHIVEVLGRTNLQFKGESLEFSLSREAALEAAMQRALAFYKQAVLHGYDTAAKAQQYQVVTEAPYQTKQSVPIFGNARFARWLFDAKVGEIGRPFNSPAVHGVVVARLSEIRPEGLSPLVEVERDVRRLVAKINWVRSAESRANAIRAKLGVSNDLTAASSIAPNLKVMSMTIGPVEVTPTIGEEPTVNAAAFALQDGAISPIVRGENAYYIIKLLKKTIPGQAEFEKGESQLREQMLLERQPLLISTWVANAKASAEIVDLRKEEE